MVVETIVQRMEYINFIILISNLHFEKNPQNNLVINHSLSKFGRSNKTFLTLVSLTVKLFKEIEKKTRQKFVLSINFLKDSLKIL